MKRLGVYLWSTILILAVSACSNQDKSNSDKIIEPIPILSTLEDLATEIDTLFSREIGESDPGAAVLISYRGDAIFAKGYGLENLSSATPVKPMSNFRMASVSKQFTALAVLNLVAEGKLSMEQPVNKLLEIQGMDGVLVKHLLNHTSGIPSYEDYFMDEWKAAPIAENEHVLAWYKVNNTPIFQPGSKWEYSNGGYNLLASIVEKVSGQNFMIYARNHVFRQMGMEKTEYFNLARPFMIHNRAFCYEKRGDAWEQVDGNKLNGLVGEGAVYTSLVDYMHYDQNLFLNQGMSQKVHALLRDTTHAAFVDESSSLAFTDGGAVYYNNGWFTSGNVDFHAGGWIGASTYVIRDKNEHLTIAVFRNTDEETDFLASRTYILAKAFLQNQE